MSEGGSLFNPGYLGTEWKWWIGQIADESTWLGNIEKGKFQSKDSVAGWGRRYKVRIMGLHDQGQDAIPDDQLPWANVMYPITAGGGQADAFQTPGLRQGNVVFGFFMDGGDQEVPVIMGVLGNNSQTQLATQTSAASGGDGPVTNNKPGVIAQSGYATPKDPPKVVPERTVPDKGLITEKPKNADQQAECSSPPPGMSLNKYGMRPDRPFNATQFQDAQLAAKQAEVADIVDPVTGRPLSKLTEKDGYSPRYLREVIDNYVANEVKEGTKNRCKAANSPMGPTFPGASIEAAATAPHIIAAGDIKRDDKNKEKIPLMKSDKQVESAQKAIQISTENLSTKVEKHLSAQQQYADAVSNPELDMEKEMDDHANEIAKYQKIIYNKMMEYSLKKYNKEMSPAVSATPMSQRWQLSEVKEKFTEKTLEDYNGIVKKLADQMRGTLTQQFDVKGAEASIAAQLAGQKSYTHPISGKAVQIPTNPKTGEVVGISTTITTVRVSPCYAEDIVGHSIADNAPAISKLNSQMVNNTGLYLKDVGSTLVGKTGWDVELDSSGGVKSAKPKSFDINSIMNKLGSIQGNMVAALQFENMKANMFPFEEPRNEAVSDYYTFGQGGAAQPDANKPNPMGIVKQISKYAGEEITKAADIPFLEPAKDQADVIFGERTVMRTDLIGGPLASRDLVLDEAGRISKEWVKKRNSNAIDR